MRQRKVNQQEQVDPLRQINVTMVELSPCRDSVWSVKEFQRKAMTAKQWPIKPENDSQLTFYEEDAANVSVPHTDTLLAELTVDNWEVSRVLIGTCSSVNLIFKEVSILSPDLAALPRKCWAQSA